jgi:predicted signal transduction protein with EAL and GGDEF domain
VAARIQQTFAEPVVVAGDAFRVGMSIGVALSPPHPATDLLTYADTAMYQAKSTARGGVVTYDADRVDRPTQRDRPPAVGGPGAWWGPTQGGCAESVRQPRG